MGDIVWQLPKCSYTPTIIGGLSTFTENKAGGLSRSYHIQLTNTVLALSVENECRAKDRYENSQPFSDGIVFRQVMTLGGDAVSLSLKNTWLAQLSESKRRDLRQLERQARLRPLLNALVRLIDFEGLWYDFKLGTLHRLLTLQCVEELATYLDTVYRVWMGITGESHKHAVDAYTARMLQGRSPALSKQDSDFISRRFNDGLLFSSVKDTASRTLLSSGCLRTRRIIPSLLTFIEDSKWLEPSSKILRDLYPLSKSSLRNTLYASYRSSLQDPTELHLRGFSKAYRRLWLHTLRYFPDLQLLKPRLNSRKRSALHLTLPEEALGCLIKYARQQGFEVGGRRESTMAFITNERIDRPIFTTNSLAGFKFGQRCGRMYEQAYLTNKSMLFLENVYSPLPLESGLTLSDFAVARDIFTAFFGEDGDGTLCVESEPGQGGRVNWEEVKDKIARATALDDGLYRSRTSEQNTTMDGVGGQGATLQAPTASPRSPVGESEQNTEMDGVEVQALPTSPRLLLDKPPSSTSDEAEQPTAMDGVEGRGSTSQVPAASHRQPVDNFRFTEDDYKKYQVEDGIITKNPDFTDPKRRPFDLEQEWGSLVVNLLEHIHNTGGYIGLHVVQVLSSQIRHQYFLSKDAYHEVWRAAATFCDVAEPVVYARMNNKFQLLPRPDKAKWIAQKPCSSHNLHSGDNPGRSFDTVLFISNQSFISNIDRPTSAKRAKTIPGQSPPRPQTSSNLLLPAPTTVLQAEETTEARTPPIKPDTQHDKSLINKFLATELSELFYVIKKGDTKLYVVLIELRGGRNDFPRPRAVNETEYHVLFERYRRSHRVFRPIVDEKNAMIQLTFVEGAWGETTPFVRTEIRKSWKSYGVLVFIPVGQDIDLRMTLLDEML